MLNVFGALEKEAGDAATDIGSLILVDFVNAQRGSQQIYLAEIVDAVS